MTSKMHSYLFIVRSIRSPRIPKRIACLKRRNEVSWPSVTGMGCHHIQCPECWEVLSKYPMPGLVHRKDLSSRESTVNWISREFSQYVLFVRQTPCA